MSGSGPGEGQVAPVPAQTCPHCGNTVPVGLYCGACGAHLSHPGDKLARRRPHSYAAFPDEPVLHLSLVSSLFPHLAHRSAAAFRLAAAFLVGLMVLFSATDLEAPVVAVAALGLPLLFQFYVYEVDVYEDNRLGLSLATLLAGAALGVGWALVGGPVVSDALQPSLVHSLTGGKVVEAAVAVPAVGEVLMCVPLLASAILLWPNASQRSPLRAREPLDGFALGAAGALGFTFAAVLTNMASSFSGGLFPGRSFVSLASEALVRGLAEPVTAAAATGLIGLALWRHGTALLRFGGGASAGWLSSPLVAFVVAVAVQIGEGFTDQARLADVPLLLVHLAGAAVLLVALRVSIHQVLLAEEREVVVGAPRACPHCHHLVPAMPFCPVCGVAEGATSKRHRGVGENAWPLASSGDAASWGGYPLVADALSPAAERSRHMVLISSVVGGVVVLAAALSLTAALEAPSAKPSVHCRLLCFGSDSFTATPDAAPVRIYHLSEGGISVALWPASQVVNPGIFGWSATTSSQVLTINLSGGSGTLNGKSVTIDGGTVEFLGVPGVGASSSEQIVDDLVSKNVSDAQLAYVVPDALVGYHVGYGAVYDVNSLSASGASRETRLFVAAAVQGGDAAVVWAYGPYDGSFASKGLLNHPSFIDLDIALVLDPMVNSVTWGG